MLQKKNPKLRTMNMQTQQNQTFLLLFAEIECFLDHMFQNPKKLFFYFKTEDTICKIDCCDLNSLLEARFKAKLQQIIQNKLQNILTNEKNFDLVSTMFQQIYNLINMSEDVFGIFENNYLIFKGFTFSSWILSIVNEQLQYNTNKEKLYQMINLVLVEEIVKLKNNKILLNQIFSIFEQLEIFNQFKIHLKKQFKVIELQELKYESFIQQFQQFVEKFKRFIDNVFSNDIKEQIVLELYNYLVDQSELSFYNFLELSWDHTDTQKMLFLIELFDVIQRKQQIITKFIWIYKKKFLSCNDLNDIILFFQKDAIIKIELGEKNKDIIKELDVILPNMLNNEKQIDPDLFSEAYQSYITQDELDQNKIEILFQVLRLMNKKEKFFESLYVRFFKRVMSQKHYDRDIMLLQKLRNEYGEEMLSDFFQLKKSFEDPLRVNEVEIKIIDTKNWPNSLKNKDQDIGIIQYLPSPFKELQMQIQDQLQSNPKNRQKNMQFQEDYNICEIEIQNEHGKSSIKCNLLQSILLFEFNEKQQIDYAFINYKYKLNQKKIVQQLENINKKLNCLEICEEKCFFAVENLKPGFYDLTKKTEQNLHSQFLINSLAPAEINKEKLLKKKEKIIKAAIVKLLKDETECADINIVQKITMNDLESIIEELIEMDYIERVGSNKFKFA